MARIRSVHPGFFTDEDLVCVSAFARLLVIGLGVEADDKGIFQWKPLTIKMRLFPADNLDVSKLLHELEEQGAIKQYEMDGRKYGAIRNFRKHQRPKTPNDVHPMPDELRNYVGLTNGISEKPPVKRGQFPPKGEKPIQMEDGGEDVEKGNDNNSNELSSSKPDDDFDLVCNSIIAKRFPNSTLQNPEVRASWLGAGLDPEKQIYPELEKICANAKAQPISWNYFSKHILSLTGGSESGGDNCDALSDQMIIRNFEKIKSNGLTPPPKMQEQYDKLVNQQGDGLAALTANEMN